jgi:hypothetical protein
VNEQIQAQLQERIEAFAADVTAILQDAVASAVTDALASDGPAKGRSKRATPSKRAASVRRKKGQKRDPKEIAKLEKALLREIKREGGRRIEQIAEKMGTSTKELKVPMQHLLDGKAVKAKGQARATRYTAK